MNRLHRLEVFGRGALQGPGRKWLTLMWPRKVLCVSSSPHPRLESLFTGYRLEVAVKIKRLVFSVKESGSLSQWIADQRKFFASLLCIKLSQFPFKTNIIDKQKGLIYKRKNDLFNLLTAISFLILYPFISARLLPGYKYCLILLL